MSDIKEGIAQILAENDGYGDYEAVAKYYLPQADSIISYLKSQNVVREIGVSMCRYYDPTLILNCMKPNHRGGLRCHSENRECKEYLPSIAVEDLE